MNVARNILAVVLGAVIGSVVNIGLITIGPMIIPVPAGADMSTVEGIAASLDLLQPQHFVFPFLAHALGTLGGAIIAYLVAGAHKKVVVTARWIGHDCRPRWHNVSPQCVCYGFARAM